MFSIFVGRHIEHGSVSLFSQWNLENLVISQNFTS
jgi:hypothetical protein